MTNPLQSPNVVDFIERVGATAFEAGTAIYIADPRAGTAKPAAIAAGLAALKYVYLKVSAWQANHLAAPAVAKPAAPPMETGRARVALIVVIVAALFTAAVAFNLATELDAQAAGHVCAPTALFCDTFSTGHLDAHWDNGWYGDGIHPTKPVNGAEIACYDPAQVAVSRGKLRLALAHRSCTAAGKTYPEATGSVSTLHSFSFTDGTLTTRVYLPGSSTALYNWPAVWTDGQPTWPTNGESDILEGLSGKACWHYHSPTGGPGGCSAMAGGWHTVSETVRNGTVTYSYDGVQVGQLASVRAPHFIILGNQSGTYGGADVASTMRVDWIEVTP